MIIIPGPRGTFLSSLRFNDLRRLREAAKRVMARIGYPVELMTDREADRIIESYGPRVAEQRLKEAVDRRLAP